MTLSVGCTEATNTIDIRILSPQILSKSLAVRGSDCAIFFVSNGPLEDMLCDPILVGIKSSWRGRWRFAYRKIITTTSYGRAGRANGVACGTLSWPVALEDNVHYNSKICD